MKSADDCYIRWWEKRSVKQNTIERSEPHASRPVVLYIFGHSIYQVQESRHEQDEVNPMHYITDCS